MKCQICGGEMDWLETHTTTAGIEETYRCLSCNNTKTIRRPYPTSGTITTCETVIT